MVVGAEDEGEEDDQLLQIRRKRWRWWPNATFEGGRRPADGTPVPFQELQELGDLGGLAGILKAGHDENKKGRNASWLFLYKNLLRVEGPVVGVASCKFPLMRIELTRPCNGKQDTQKLHCSRRQGSC